jgi:hypothetical protein
MVMMVVMMMAGRKRRSGEYGHQQGSSNKLFHSQHPSMA